VAKHRKATEYLRFYAAPNTFSNALSAIRSAIVLKAFDIVESPEGQVLRSKNMHNVLQLRSRLADNGFETYGAPSPIVCVEMGTEAMARLLSRQLHANGLVANLIEYPAVPKGQARPAAGDGKPHRKRHRLRRRPNHRGLPARNQRIAGAGAGARSPVKRKRCLDSYGVAA
jgi:hypothetical protein